MIGLWKKLQVVGARCGIIALAVIAVAPVSAVAQQLGALAPDNLAMTRPQAPFFLTGTWQHDLGQPGSWRFIPDEFTLTPEAQAHYDAGQAAMADGKIYRDDIGQCWPSGLPLIMTRVWPIAMIQLPTAIYMISNFMNSLRIIYLDGREHTDPDIVVPSFNGESIGRWEGDTLVVDTRHFTGHHHWMDQGGASIPASEELHIVERIRLIDDGDPARDRIHDDRSRELGRRLGDDQVVRPSGRNRYHGSGMLAGPERLHAKHDIEFSGPVTLSTRFSGSVTIPWRQI